MTLKLDPKNPKSALIVRQQPACSEINRATPIPSRCTEVMSDVRNYLLTVDNDKQGAAQVAELTAKSKSPSRDKP